MPINQLVCVILNLWNFVFIDRISNSQTSEPIGSPKSPMVDLEVEEQEETKEEGSKRLQMRMWIQVEKEGLPQMFGSIL